MKIKKRLRKDNQVEEIDITSLLDILVILIVFLLSSFNSSKLNFDFIQKLTLPFSNNKAVANEAIIIQINKEGDISVDQDSIGNIKNNQTLTLLAEIIEKKQKENNALLNLPISFVLDKSLPYKQIDLVMNKASIKRDQRFKLIVQGET
jgi:biopolymer transport protein ExbD